MAIKKSELYSSLWSSCDELRGGMDALKGKTDIGDQINKKILGPLAKANERSLTHRFAIYVESEFPVRIRRSGRRRAAECGIVRAKTTESLTASQPE